MNLYEHILISFYLSFIQSIFIQVETMVSYQDTSTCSTRYLKIQVETMVSDQDTSTCSTRYLKIQMVSDSISDQETSTYPTGDSNIKLKPRFQTKSPQHIQPGTSRQDKAKQRIQFKTRDFNTILFAVISKGAPLKDLGQTSDLCEVVF